MITFKNENAHIAFHSMCEGMWENARDDYVSADSRPGPRADLFEQLIHQTGWHEGLSYPLSYSLSADVVLVAHDVLANIADNENEDFDPSLIDITDE